MRAALEQWKPATDPGRTCRHGAGHGRAGCPRQVIALVWRPTVCGTGRQKGQWWGYCSTHAEERGYRP
jgi:hypothetical protein